MKAVLFLALVGGAASAITAWKADYTSNLPAAGTTAICSLKEGYVFKTPTGAAGSTATASCLSTDNANTPNTPYKTGTATALGLLPIATGCAMDPGTVTTEDSLVFLGCADGYTPSGPFTATYGPAAAFTAGCATPPPNTVPILLDKDGTVLTAWPAGAAGTKPTSPGQPYGIGTLATFKCTKTVVTSGCNITCNGGAACATGQTDAVLSGSPLVASSLCAPGATVQTSTVNGTAATTCNAPTKNVDWLVTCAFGVTPGPDGPSVENATTVTAANSAATAAAVANPTGVSAKVNSGVCAGACRERGNSGFPSRCEQAAVGNIAVSVGFAIQCSKCFNCFNGEGSNVTGLRQAVPGSLTITCTGTAAAQKACWEYAACNGLIAPGEPCIIDLLAQQCPECPSESKKGLLGLLGLLGLIPLLLCSLLLCCLLLACRRKKAERDVHFATFDAGVPNCSPPVVHNTASVYHQTHVGAPHVAGPVACY